MRVIEERSVFDKNAVLREITLHKSNLSFKWISETSLRSSVLRFRLERYEEKNICRDYFVWVLYL